MSKRLHYILLSLLFSSFILKSFAQTDTVSSEKKIKIFGLPFIFYTPETKLGFGAAGVLSFNLHKTDSAQLYEIPPRNNISQIQPGLAYTLNKQWLFYIPFRLYFAENNYLLYGETGYHKYSYNFYGIGEAIDLDSSENYSVNYPRIRLNALHKISRNMYAGIKYWFDDFTITELDTGNLFTTSITGISGGIATGIGFIALYDSRDKIYFPTHGSYAEISFMRFDDFLASAYIYNRFTVDAATYFSTGKDDVLAFNVYGDMTFGATPFNQLAFLGGTKKLRGIEEGAYRNDHAFAAQAEYRAVLFWKLGLNVFAGTGFISPELDITTFSKPISTVGAGLRLQINKETKTNLRIDYGVGKNTSGFYITFGEAF